MRSSLEIVREVLLSEDPSLAAGRALESVRGHYPLRLLGAVARRLRSADLAALVRDVLRSEAEAQRADPSTVSVTLGNWNRWPETTSWPAYGLQVSAASGGQRIRARPWRPEWLPLSGQWLPERAAYAGRDRRCMDPVEPDPFLGLVKRSNYLCHGQRDAVRAALTAPQCATLLVDLPTGSGKSLVPQVLAQLPTVEGDPNGLVVVVVPTTALALDQERTSSDLVKHATAYYSGSGEAHRERNRGIWQRIRAETQRVVFTSPESFTGSLREVLFEVAQRGGLRAVVIDEAHLVAGWGDEFRSSFQQVAGLRRALLRTATRPFRTVLLSATLTETAVETLETLFGGETEFGMVSAAQLRPEPEYWAAHCASEPEKESRIEEAIRHLPRPLILYTTRVADAEGWGQHLRECGYERLRVMTGETPASERTRIIQEWAAREVDLVVATSAFGLGIDQSEVRTVIHACLPETLDRFYQEVGRGGRDGRACLSLVVYTDNDRDRAWRMNRKTIIGTERGLQRWQRMWEARKPVEGDDQRYRVPLEVSPGLSVRYIDMRNRLSTQWHVRTLTLMARAGLIQLDAEIPIRSTTPEASLNEKPAREGPCQVVKVTTGEHLRKETWDAVVEPVRHRTHRSHERGLELLEELLEGRRCAGESLAEAYTLSERPETHRPGVIPAVNCGGCPWCRARFRTVPSTPPIPSSIPWHSNPAVTPALGDLLVGHRLLPVTYAAQETLKRRTERFTALLRWAVDQGVRNVVAPRALMDALIEQDRQLGEISLFFAADEVASPGALQHLPRFPTIFFLLPGRPLERSRQWIRWSEQWTAESCPLLLVLPEGTPDPNHPGREVCDLFGRPAYPLSILEERVGL